MSRGSQFGPYQLLERLGIGGMGEIYRAVLRRGEGFEKPLAIKRILPNLGSDPAFVRMFNREARVAALLNHQNIVQIYDFGCEDGDFYIAMELVDGADLRTLLFGGVPSVQTAFAILGGTARALDYAHRRETTHGKGFVHRDVSPGNVLISREGEVKLTDFGLVTSDFEVSEAGTVKGKFSYMSPEQTHGDQVDARSDLFSWGVVAYELLAGVRPFRGEVLEVLQSIREGRFEPLDEPGVPDALAKLVSRCMQVEPDDRPESAETVLSVLEELARREGWGDGRSALRAWITSTLPPSQPARTISQTVVGDAPIHPREASGMSVTAAATPVALTPPETQQPDTPPPEALPPDTQPPEAALLRDAGAGGRVAVREGSESVKVGSGVPKQRHPAWGIGVGLALVAFFLWGVVSSLPRDGAPEGPIFDLQIGRDAGSGRDVINRDVIDSVAVHITTDPEGAEVLVAGFRLGSSPVDTHLADDRPVMIAAEHPGYSMARQEITPEVLAAESWTGVVTLRLSPIPTTVSLDALPEGLTVEVDGQQVGTTPTVLTRTDFGSHVLRVHGPGLTEAIETTLTFEPGAELQVMPPVTRQRVLRVEGDPGTAAVLVQAESSSGQNVRAWECEVPCRLDLDSEIDVVTIGVGAPGHQSQEARVHLVDGETVWQFSLEPEVRVPAVQWRSRVLDLRGGGQTEVTQEQVQQTVHLSASEGELTGTLSAQWRLDGGRVHGTIAIRTTPWSRVVFEGEEQDTPAEFRDRFEPGRHRITIAPRGGDDTYEVTLVVR